MKKILFLGACLLAVASQPVMAQTGGPDVLVVRVSDNPGSARMIIVRPGGKTEEVNFNGGSNAKSLKDSGVVMQQALAALYQEGYALKSTFSGENGNNATLVFIKEK